MLIFIFGIIAFVNSNVTISDGLVKINAPRGIHLNGKNNTSELHFDGGETEITSSITALSMASATKKDPVFGEDYFHKNYSDTEAANRQETSDTDLTDDSGVSKKYVLVTPAWPIEYDLGHGTLEPGKTNPIKYSRVDSFTLYNPIPNSRFMQFVGWTGTDLEDPTETVTIAEGSKGSRKYTAKYESLLDKVARVEPTCTTPGNIEYWVDPADGSIYLDEEGEQKATEDQVTLPALGHKWGAPTYAWNDDLSKCTAKQVCERDASHVETETVSSSSKQTKQPTCTGKGETTYTATFSNTGFTEQIKTKETPALGHEWGEWVVTKKPTTTAEGVKTRTCKRDSSHVQTESIPKTKSNSKSSSTSKAASPATGDNSTLLLGALALAAISLCVAAGAYVAVRKESD